MKKESACNNLINFFWNDRVIYMSWKYENFWFDYYISSRVTRILIIGNDR